MCSRWEQSSSPDPHPDDGKKPPLVSGYLWAEGDAGVMLLQREPAELHSAELSSQQVSFLPHSHITATSCFHAGGFGYLGACAVLCGSQQWGQPGVNSNFGLTSFSDLLKFLVYGIFGSQADMS